jgi:hypothetical protein
MVRRKGGANSLRAQLVGASLSFPGSPVSCGTGFRACKCAARAACLKNLSKRYSRNDRSVVEEGSFNRPNRS